MLEINNTYTNYLTWHFYYFSLGWTLILFYYIYNDYLSNQLNGGVLITKYSALFYNKEDEVKNWHAFSKKF